VEKYGTARQVTNGSAIRRMRIACWITMATDSHLEYVKILCFTATIHHTDAPQYYIDTYIAIFSPSTEISVPKQSAQSVSFIAVLSTATVTGYPGGCSLCVQQYSCRGWCGDKSDTFIVKLGRSRLAV